MMATCAMCGKEFERTSPKQIYCHHNCAQRAYEGRQGMKVRDWFEPTRIETFYINEDTRRAERSGGVSNVGDR
ncbi:MAG TPA: hypothetical protein VFY83_04495 [Anaerolineales bacterium]|nr:hypothetical protein [Anaerolineales bacterium]